jgi:hypothetical protein
VEIPHVPFLLPKLFVRLGPQYAEQIFMHVPIAAINEDHGSALWKNDVRAAGRVRTLILYLPA